MDFSSQLANLQRTVTSAASSGSSDRHDSSDHRGRKRQRRHRYFDENAMRQRSSLFLIIVRNKTRLNEPLGILHSCLSLSDDLPYEDIWKEWAMSEDS